MSARVGGGRELGGDWGWAGGGAERRGEGDVRVAGEGDDVYIMFWRDWSRGGLIKRAMAAGML